MRSKLKKKLKNLSPVFGEITKINSTIIEAIGISPSIGDIVKIHKSLDESYEMGMVVSLEKKSFFITPFGFTDGFRITDKIYIETKGLNIKVSDDLLGRVVNPFMEPIDDLEEMNLDSSMPMLQAPIKPLKRGIIDEVFTTGVKTIDGLLTCGKGQKLGIFAGSGVGKSTLMGMIVRGASAKIKIIALIGERGREVPEFIQKNLKGDLTNTILIVATSDDSALMRKYGAFAAMSVAEYFKNKGEDVLFMMDSVTRFAMAQREIGLSLGEPPTSKGYPPSTLALLPQLMERAGKEEGKGSITAFFTVLVDGDDMSDPIADQSRSILDGHIVLSRNLTDVGIYPPIDILSSASRVMNDIVTKEHEQKARNFKKLYALLKENETLIKIGAYKNGSDKDLDEAIVKKKKIENFLKQEENQEFSFNDIIEKFNKFLI